MRGPYQQPPEHFDVHQSLHINIPPHAHQAIFLRGMGVFSCHHNWLAAVLYHCTESYILKTLIK